VVICLEDVEHAAICKLWIGVGGGVGRYARTEGPR
jgi:hypothetical protein